MSYIKSLLEDINAECENENIPVKAFIAYLDNHHVPLEEWQDHIPSFHEYFNFEAWGRDLLQGDYWEIDGYYFGSY